MRMFSLPPYPSVSSFGCNPPLKFSRSVIQLLFSLSVAYFLCAELRHFLLFFLTQAKITVLLLFHPEYRALPVPKFPLPSFVVVYRCARQVQTSRFSCSPILECTAHFLFPCFQFAVPPPPAPAYTSFLTSEAVPTTLSSPLPT